jgi:uncharacterized damage-inducible protein DinB
MEPFCPMIVDPAYFRTLARYNRWANERLYGACAKLPPSEIAKPRAAFFGSIFGTLNHLVAGDRAWLDRLEGAEAVVRGYDQPMAEDFAALSRLRAEHDARIIVLVDDLGPEELEQTLYYTSIAGDRAEMPTHWALAHMFNHQTHHRGQAHGLLSQTEAAPPPLDIAIFLRGLPRS